METNPESHPRVFGLALGAAAATAALWLSSTRWQDAATVLGIVAAALIPSALLYPPILRGPERCWTAFVAGLGWLNTRIVLSLVFFLILTPLGLLMRLAGRDILGLRRLSGASSYLEIRRVRRFAPESFRRLY